MSDELRYLVSHEIDKSKWDRCIENAPNGLIYASALYLDMMADHWSAVVVGDYKAVMPLPWRKAWFVPYHYKVPFISQGGIFGEIDPSLFSALKKQLFSRIRFGDLLLNFHNVQLAKYLRAKSLYNMVLDIKVSHEELSSAYMRVAQKSLQKAAQAGLTYVQDGDVKEAISLFRKHYGSRIRPIREVDFERFRSLSLYLQHPGRAFVRKVEDGKGKLLAMGLFFRDARRIYNMMNTVVPNSRGRTANFLLFDRLIAESEATGMKLDFQGSEVPAIRKFYESFGAVNEPYYWYRKLV